MRVTGLHAVTRHAPKGGVKIELAPRGFADLAGTANRENHELKGQLGNGCGSRGANRVQRRSDFAIG